MTSSGKSISVLLIDDDEDDYFMLRDLLSQVQGQKFVITWAPSYDKGKALLQRRGHEVCFLDYRLGGKTGLELLKEVLGEGVKTPLILLTGYGEHEVDLEAMRVGAADYLVKDQVNPLLLERSIRYSIHRAQALQAILDREVQIIMQDRLASVGLLASSLAHEIGNPLGIIRGRAEFLEHLSKNDPKLKQNLDVIISQIDRVSNLIRSLLNLARGDQLKSSETISLKGVVREVVDLMGHEFRRREIEMRNELTDSIPIQVQAESAPLHQVLLNLFVNSLHAIETAIQEGRVRHFIRIYAKDLDQKVVLCIVDSGCGISKENLKNLFKPFFTTKEVGVGTGLGLATSYRIVESWGGSIQVQSTEGEGTEFQIFLPKPNF